MPRLLFVLCLLVVAGCAPLEWSRPDATPDQARADAADCQRRAWQEAQFRSFAYTPPRRSGRWRDPFWSDPFFDETRLARFCMEARGYQLQAVPQR